MLCRLFVIFLFFFPPLLSSQEREIPNYTITKNPIESKPLYEIGIENEEILNSEYSIFEGKNISEVIDFFKNIPTNNKNYTVERLVYKILISKLDFGETEVSDKEDRLLLEIRVKKLFELGKFTDIDNFFSQIPPNYENPYVNLKRIEAYLLRNEFKNACSLVNEQNEETSFQLGKFDIICSIINQNFEKARFNLELLKELNVPGDILFIELAYKIMGDIEVSQKEIEAKNLTKFSSLTPILLSYLQIAEISPTFENLKDAPISSLIFILSSPTTNSEIKTYCAERLVKLKRISPNILAEVYQLNNFKNEEIQNVIQVYKTLSPVKSRSLLYQAIVKEVDPNVKFELIKYLLVNGKKNKLFPSLAHILKDSLNYEDLEDLSPDDIILILDLFFVTSQYSKAEKYIDRIKKDSETDLKEFYLYLLKEINSNPETFSFDKRLYNLSTSPFSLNDFSNILTIYSLKENLNQEIVEQLSNKGIYNKDNSESANIIDLLSLNTSRKFSKFYYLKAFFRIIDGKYFSDLSSFEKYIALKIIKIIEFEDIFEFFQKELLDSDYE